MWQGGRRGISGERRGKSERAAYRAEATFFEAVFGGPAHRAPVSRGYYEMRNRLSTVVSEREGTKGPAREVPGGAAPIHDDPSNPAHRPVDLHGPGARSSPTSPTYPGMTRRRRRSRSRSPPMMAEVVDPRDRCSPPGSPRCQSGRVDRRPRHTKSDLWSVCLSEGLEVNQSIYFQETCWSYNHFLNLVLSYDFYEV